MTLLQPKVIFEDDLFLVLDKPAGLVVDKSETQQENTLENWLEERVDSRLRGNDKVERQGIVHRLDKDTSGVILVAKTPASLENLQAQFKDRETKKEYLALVHGVIDQPGVVEGAIGRNPGNREKFIVTGEGKEAVTEYEPVEILQLSEDRLVEIFEGFNKIQMRKLDRTKYGQLTLVRCKPRTGRTHQIRVHLKHIGNPIVADEKYGGRKTARLDKRWCPRQFLHAAKIGFKHPESGDWLEFEAPLPDDLKNALWTVSSHN